MPHQRPLPARTIVASREHDCDLCPDPINPGEPYKRALIVTDAGPVTSKQHARRCWEE